MKHVKEEIHLKSGGRSRVRGSGEVVMSTREQVVEFQDGNWQFVKLKKYIELYGDPRANKAKVTKHKVYGQGVYVDLGDKDIIPVKRFRRSTVGRKTTAHDGEEVVSENEVSEAYEEGVGGLAEDIQDASAALTLTDTRAKAADHSEKHLLASHEAKQQEDDRSSDDESKAEGSDSDASEKDGSSSNSGGSDKDSSGDDSESLKRKQNKQGRCCFPRAGASAANHDHGPRLIQGAVSNVQKQFGDNSAAAAEETRHRRWHLLRCGRDRCVGC